MKVSATKDNLAKALGAVGRIVGSQATLPVLAHVLVATDGKRLKLSTTNLELGINYWIGAKVDQAGAITVPARLLAEFVGNLPDDTVSLELDKTNLKVTTNHYQSTFNGIEAAEFPSIPSLKKSALFSLPAQDFKAAASVVVLAASTDDTRPVLGGVYLYSEGSNLVIVATDSYRLAEKIIPRQKGQTGQINLIVPARTIQELLRMIGDDSETLEVVVEENQALFKLDNIELISRLIDGQFPDYRSLIPKDSPTVVTVDTAELGNLTKVAGLFAQTGGGSITLEVDNQSSSLRLRSVASQVGENVSDTKAEINGDDAQVALNYRYLGDALSVINSPQIKLAVSGKVNPVVIRPTEDKSYLHIIMPLRS